MSQARLVSQKTMVSPRPSAWSSRATISILSIRCARQTIWRACGVGCLAVAFFGSARTWVGRLRYLRDSATISPGMVAENSIVCRSAGDQLEDPLDVGQEAQVEHAVGLVEHQRW